MANGITSSAPGASTAGKKVWEVNHDPVIACSNPIAIPPATASGIDDRLPINAAPRAGTIKSVSLPTCRDPITEPARIPASPAIIAASIQLYNASRLGLYPSNTAPFSLPAAARVAKPMRVKR